MREMKDFTARWSIQKGMTNLLDADMIDQLVASIANNARRQINAWLCEEGGHDIDAAGCRRCGEATTNRTLEVQLA